MIAAVLYTRISESDDRSTSLERQEADLRAYAAQQGWSVVAVFEDNGVSGGKSREKAAEALAMLRDGRADVLAVWKVDRWSRQGLVAVADLLSVLDKRGRFVALLDSVDSASGEIDTQLGFLAVMARAERKAIQTRVKSSRRRLREKRQWAGGTPPYGYAIGRDGTTPILVPVDAEAEVIREAARRVLEGESVYRITLDLNARGIPPRRSASWSVAALKGVLTGLAVVGRMKHAGSVLRDDTGQPEECWEPILDAETWERVGVRLDTKASGPRRRRARLLSGIARCGECGQVLYVKYNGDGLCSYGCSARSNGRECSGVSIGAEALEADVTARFLDLLGDAEVFELREARHDDADSAEVDRAIRETASAMAEDDADVVALTVHLAALKERRASLRTTAPRPARLVGTGRTFAEVWAAGDTEARNDLLRANTAILQVNKGVRGQHGYNESRVIWIPLSGHWTEDDEPGDFRPGQLVSGPTRDEG